jgi:hypothetical protein
MSLFSILSIIIFSIECRYAERRYVECRDYLKVMLIVVVLNVIMLNVVAPSWAQCYKTLYSRILRMFGIS